MPFATTRMDLEVVILSEVSQIKASITRYHLYVESKKYYKWTYLQSRNRVRDAESKSYGYQVGQRGEGLNWEIGIWHIDTTIYKIITSKIYYVAQRTLFNTLQRSVWEKNLKKSGYVIMYNWSTLLYSKVLYTAL